MKRVFFLTLVLILCSATADAQQGRFGLGLRAGPSAFSQGVIPGDVDDQVGPVTGVNALYLVTDWLAFGIGAEWEMHNFEVGHGDIGDNWTISIIPFVELRGPYSSYMFAGAGYNLNEFDGDGLYDLEVDNSIAFKGGAGWDIFVTDNIALNVELGWKYNKADADLKMSDGSKTFFDELNLSVITALFGARYYF